LSSSTRNTLSGFYGVALDIDYSEKWRAFIDVPNHGYFMIGLFDSAEAAAHAYDEVACRIEGAELNFKREVMGGGGNSTRPQEVEGYIRGNNGNLKRTSKFAGVNFDKRSGNWKSRVTISGKKITQAYFENEVEAAENYDNLVSQE